MRNAPRDNRSIWQATAVVPDHPALDVDIRVDVCIVGGGIAGLTTAYLLADAGARVAVVERATIAGGETGRTTAHLSTALDHLYCDVERDVGAKGISLAAASHGTAIDLIERIATSEGIACDLQRVDGYLFAPPDGSADVLTRELDAARRAGLNGVTLEARAPLMGYDTGACLRFPRQGQFHPVKYLAGLARAVTSRGGRIFGHTQVVRVNGGSPATVTAASGRVISANAIVVATNSPIHENLLIHAKQAPYRTYAIAAKIPRGAVPLALYWDTADPFHYVRLAGGAPEGDGETTHDFLIAGGADHRVGEANDGGQRLDDLERWTRERFPIFEIAYRWSGQVMESIDGVGLIGRDRLDQPNVYLVTGDCGQGMTHGTIAGMLLADVIAGRSNAWRGLYDPSRNFIASSEFYQESLHLLRQYADWLTGGDVSTSESIPRGEGAVVRRGPLKVAAYRDERGVLTECSAICPHMGCLVRWNSSDQTWNCPCHGSQFDRYGKVTSGPASVSLSKIS